MDEHADTPKTDKPGPQGGDPIHPEQIELEPATPEPTKPKKPDRAAAAGLPSEFGPEVRVLKLRPTMFRARPFSYIGLASLMAGAGVLALVAAIKKEPLWPADGFWLVVCLIMFMAGAIVMGAWFLKTMSACLDVTTKRTTENHGLFSRATSEVLHDNIRNIAVKQSFIDRVFNVGVIEISSSGQSGIEITMKNIRDPHGVRETIDKYREL
ncbi:MAG: PH domain-containing protein [Phycisphaera sp.]|nr:MAG: PH domain-containing protein [Phycisphaera sp.]